MHFIDHIARPFAGYFTAFTHQCLTSINCFIVASIFSYLIILPVSTGLVCQNFLIRELDVPEDEYKQNNIAVEMLYQDLR